MADIMSMMPVSAPAPKKATKRKSKRRRRRLRPRRQRRRRKRKAARRSARLRRSRPKRKAAKKATKRKAAKKSTKRKAAKKATKKRKAAPKRSARLQRRRPRSARPPQSARRQPRRRRPRKERPPRSCRPCPQPVRPDRFAIQRRTKNRRRAPRRLFCFWPELVRRTGSRPRRSAAGCYARLRLISVLCRRRLLPARSGADLLRRRFCRRAGRSLATGGALCLADIGRAVARDAQRLARHDGALRKTVPATDVLHADVVAAGDARERVAAIHAIVERAALRHRREHRLRETEFRFRARARRRARAACARAAPWPSCRVR